MNNCVLTCCSNGCLLYVFSAAREVAPQEGIRAEHMRKRSNSTQELNAQVGKALRLGRVGQALELYESIEKQKPDDARWSLRKGDLLLRMGRDADASVAYERAVSLYAAGGFEERAAAAAKLMPQVKAADGEPTLQPHETHQRTA